MMKKYHRNPLIFETILKKINGQGKYLQIYDE